MDLAAGLHYFNDEYGPLDLADETATLLNAYHQWSVHRPARCAGRRRYGSKA
jgi:hypothetical protein